MFPASFVEWLTAAGEFAIAGVIYYEVEEHRSSTFLSEVQAPELYEKRAKLYDEYARVPGAATLKDRAEAFRKKLWDDQPLRLVCDQQWTNLNRLRYVVRHSLVHGNLVAEWFPQVMVSMWAMTALYIRERQQLRQPPAENYGIKAVRESLRKLKKDGLRPLTIYSNDGKERVVISVEDLQKMLVDLDAPFR
jgi:hypothetical protein